RLPTPVGAVTRAITRPSSVRSASGPSYVAPGVAAGDGAGVAASGLAAPIGVALATAVVVAGVGTDTGVAVGSSATKVAVYVTGVAIVCPSSVSSRPAGEVASVSCDVSGTRTTERDAMSPVESVARRMISYATSGDDSPLVAVVKRCGEPTRSSMYGWT